MGSHLCGRIDHKFDGGQQGADVERVEHIKKRYPHMHINLQPGRSFRSRRYGSLLVGFLKLNLLTGKQLEK